MTTPVPLPQLSLPHVDTAPPGAVIAGLPRARRVYVNRSLRMENVEWVGFDMDYTLAQARRGVIRTSLLLLRV